MLIFGKNSETVMKNAISCFGGHFYLLKIARLSSNSLQNFGEMLVRD